MALGRCPGECGYEDTPNKVESHMRLCKDYARVFMSDGPTASLSPVEAYAAAHPPAAASGRKSRRSPSVPGPEDPPVAAGEPLADDHAPQSEDSGEPAGEAPGGSARTSRRRRARSAPAPAPLVPAPTAVPAVTVEYWDRVPDLLESMRADAAAATDAS